MEYSKKNIEFAHSPIGVCSLILWVEAMAAATAIGVFSYVYNSNGIQDRDVVRGSVILLALLGAGCCVMAIGAWRHRYSIALENSSVLLETLSGIREILYYDDIASVKSNREYVFIRLKNGRMIGLLADDFKDIEVQQLFVEELRKRITEIFAESEKAQAESKPLSVWETGMLQDEKHAA